MRTKAVLLVAIAVLMLGAAETVADVVVDVPVAPGTYTTTNISGVLALPASAGEGSAWLRVQGSQVPGSIRYMTYPDTSFALGSEFCLYLDISEQHGYDWLFASVTRVEPSDGEFTVEGEFRRLSWLSLDFMRSGAEVFFYFFVGYDPLSFPVGVGISPAISTIESVSIIWRDSVAIEAESWGSVKALYR